MHILQGPRYGYWPVLKGRCDTEDPELAEDAAESQVGILHILHGHHPWELRAADQVLLGWVHQRGFLVATICRGCREGAHSLGGQGLGPCLLVSTSPQDPPLVALHFAQF